ncbi:hypothetical protein HanXRQr2_Chr03g0096971 [Helianthus annuus]|uniref:Uncharacterized protein n=1 Tax=Helianthus annuus TaxID=4232 RepID=A0A9K3JE89_HELAN|nr:hypothetical protein HanXRQr2_Chr03g0096971 [Helianthus annuus]
MFFYTRSFFVLQLSTVANHMFVKCFNMPCLNIQCLCFAFTLIKQDLIISCERIIRVLNEYPEVQPFSSFGLIYN